MIFEDDGRPNATAGLCFEKLLDVLSAGAHGTPDDPQPLGWLWLKLRSCMLLLDALWFWVHRSL